MSSSEVQALTCAPQPSTSVLYSNSDYVFKGKIRATMFDEANSAVTRGFFITQEIWKGTSSKIEGSAINLSYWNFMNEYDDYVVFANHDANGLLVLNSLCYGSFEVNSDEGKRVLRELYEIKTPTTSNIETLFLNELKFKISYYWSNYKNYIVFILGGVYALYDGYKYRNVHSKKRTKKIMLRVLLVYLGIIISVNLLHYLYVSYGVWFFN